MNDIIEPIEKPESTLPEEIRKMRKTWSSHSTILRIIHVLLGIIAIVTSVTVAARVVDPNSNLMAYLAWSAAVSSTLLTSMSLEAKSNHYRTAWRMLNVAVLRYRTEKNSDIAKLNDAYEKGESTIGDVNIQVKT